MELYLDHVVSGLDHVVLPGGGTTNPILMQQAIDCIKDTNGGDDFTFSGPLGPVPGGIDAFINFTLAQSAQFGGGSTRFYINPRLIELNIGSKITGKVMLTGGIKALSEAPGIFPIPPNTRFEFTNRSVNGFKCEMDHGQMTCKINSNNIVFRHGPNPVPSFLPPPPPQ